MKTKKQKPTLSDLSLSELKEKIAMSQAIAETAKANINSAEAELRRRFESRMTEYYTSTEKTYGQHTFEVDGVKLIGEVKATVKWDSAALQKLSKELPSEIADRLFKVDFSVPEKVYQSITSDKLLDRLLDARTVKYSEPKISFAE